MLPDKIKIGGINYDITQTVFKNSDVEKENEVIHWGTIEYPKASIEINNKLDLQIKKQTLIHEIMHGIFDECGLDLADEEDIVNRTGKVLYQVLVDNDFSFIKE